MWNFFNFVSYKMSLPQRYNVHYIHYFLISIKMYFNSFQILCSFFFFNIKMNMEKKINKAELR